MMMNRKRKGSELLLASSKKPCIVVFSSGDDDVNVSCKKRLAATPPTSSSSDFMVNGSSSSNNNKKRLLAVAATAPAPAPPRTTSSSSDVKVNVSSSSNNNNDVKVNVSSSSNNNNKKKKRLLAVTATCSSSGRGLKRKRKAGSELLAPSKKPCIVKTNLNSHYSLQDWLKKRKEDVNVNVNVSSSSNNNNKKKKRLLAVACAAAATSSSSGRGMKRKIGCIDMATKKNKIDEDYVKGASTAPLGKGKFASVWKCTCRATGLDFACKSLPKGGEETVQREVEIMQHLSGHPGVVTLNAVYEDLQSFHLVMELCSGGTLRDQMAIQARFSEQQAASILKELMLVLKYCHQMGVVHRDIKPENILLTASGKIKLADFGLALRITNGQSLAGLAGSPAYVAPEVLCGNYSEKVDVWSAGILLHALLVGVLPFQGHSPEDMFQAIKNVELNFHTGIWESVSKPARDLLERMLTRNVDSRITADQVLSHPWILFYTERNLKSLSFKVKVKDESGLVDALAVAIANVRISEPKSSRLCMPTSLIREQCLSNVTSNNLCKAC